MHLVWNRIQVLPFELYNVCGKISAARVAFVDLTAIIQLGIFKIPQQLISIVTLDNLVICNNTRHLQHCNK